MPSREPIKCDITLKNSTKSVFVSKKFIQQVVGETLRVTRTPISKTTVSLGVSVVGESRIKSLNRRHRKVNRPTDVLSFPLADSIFNQYGIISLGDLFICPSIARKKAKALELSWRYEVSWLLVHGLLHLLGYDHEQSHSQAKLMEEMEVKIIERLKVR